MEHGNQGMAQSTTKETNINKEEQPPAQAVSQEMSLILSMSQIIGMRTPPGSMERESSSHAKDKCPPFSLETELLNGPQSDLEIGSGDNMKGSSSLGSSQDLNPQLSVSELKTQSLKEAQNSKEYKTSAQTASHLEMSLFMPMQAFIGKVTTRGNVKAPPSSKCIPFPVNLGCSSGPQNEAEKEFNVFCLLISSASSLIWDSVPEPVSILNHTLEWDGSGDTFQIGASFLDNTSKGKESDNIEKGEKILCEESVILNVDPLTIMEPAKEIETCATQTEEASTPQVSHKAVQIPEETSLKAQDTRNELQSSDHFCSYSNMSGLIENEEKCKEKQEEKKVKLEKKEKMKLEETEEIKDKENEKEQSEGRVKKERQKEERAKNGGVMGKKDTRKNEKHKKGKEEKVKKERMQEKKECIKKEKHKEEKEKRMEKEKINDEKEEKKKNTENSEEEREDKRKMIEAEKLTLQKRLQLKGRMKGMKNSEVWWPKEKKLIGKIAIQNFIQLLPSSSTILEGPDIEDHVNRPKKRHMDLQEHLDQKFVGQKGKANRKERKCKGRVNVSNLEEEDQAEKNKIKRIDKKQKLGIVKVLRRRSICFQKMTLGDLHPLYTPRPCRIYLLTLEGTHKETANITNGDRLYPEEREKVILEERLMTQLVQKGKKTTIPETFPKVKEMALSVPNRFHGCWLICQEGKNLNAFKKLQAIYQQQLLKQRELIPSEENADPKIWKESTKTTTLVSNEEIIGAVSENLPSAEKKRSLSAHDLVRFGPRTLVGARIAREEDMGTVRGKKEKENKAIILTHNLVRFSSRTIVGAIKASAVTEWEEVSGTQDEKKNISPFMDLKKSQNHAPKEDESDKPLMEVLIGFSLGNSLGDSLGI
ncbi:uncharacterized protein LOC141514628 isoform X2 [Macrotis lagotis]|uniref:uncharacterized protein LOC141514628 isoform X2 n=1 Tax=Macrotis lagotis TaxID=92651 RepID=UPI003D6906A3